MLAELHVVSILSGSLSLHTTGLDARDPLLWLQHYSIYSHPIACKWYASHKLVLQQGFKLTELRPGLPLEYKLLLPFIVLLSTATPQINPHRWQKQGTVAAGMLHDIHTQRLAIWIDLSGW
jgi:hypothetical protein